MRFLACAAVFLAALTLASHAAPAPAPKKPEPAIWTIQKENGATITLFGSIHILSDNDKWRTAALEAAYKTADVIVLETDLSVMGTSEMQAYIAKESANVTGVTLSELLGPEQAAVVAKAAEAAGISYAAMEPYKPWFAALQLSVSNAVAKGFNSDQGVDKALESEGRADGKAIGYFEKTREQLDVFIDLPMDEQIAFLVLGAHEVLERPNELRDLIAAWAKGDVEEIDELMNRGMEGAPLAQKTLLADRNARWVKVIREFFLKDNNSYLIVVGAGHLAGDDSVIAMLRDAGIEVEGP
ncbi:MAG: TraB/GumN family protein [Micropepsaceae bacterium]